jgi:hypothetical protein
MSEQYSNIKFCENPFGGSHFFQAEGRKDGQRYCEDNSRFLKFLEGTYKANHISSGDESQSFAF